MAEPTNKKIWNKVPIVVYIYPEMLERIDETRESIKRSTFLEAIIHDALYE